MRCVHSATFLDGPQGSFLIVLGTNGSGKSTLLNAVAGTFIVDSGKIILAGHEITIGRSIAERS